MRITIEKRLNKTGDKTSIRLVYWYGSYTDENGKLKHNRKIEKIQSFLYANPKNIHEIKHNKDTEALIENIRAKRITEAAQGQYGFTDAVKTKTQFWPFFDSIMNQKTGSNHSIWIACKIHLEKYASNESLSFERINAEWIKGARDYLEKKAVGKTGNKLSKNTAGIYFNKLRAVINAAFNKGILHKNPLTEIPGIKAETSKRVYLNIEEVRALAATDCRYEVLKRGFLFSCLTGLRWGDVQKLDWEQVSILNGGHRITFSQQKTKTLQYLDITPQAFKLMGEQQKAGRVFEGLRYSTWMNVALLQWGMAAGISKHVTFHAGRHTFAVVLLSNGADIYTVSKLLGHSEIKTTQIYADVVDKVRKEAMHKVPDIGL